MGIFREVATNLYNRGEDGETIAREMAKDLFDFIKSNRSYNTSDAVLQEMIKLTGSDHVLSFKPSEPEPKKYETGFYRATSPGGSKEVIRINDRNEMYDTYSIRAQSLFDASIKGWIIGEKIT